MAVYPLTRGPKLTKALLPGLWNVLPRQLGPVVLTCDGERLVY